MKSSTVNKILLFSVSLGVILLLGVFILPWKIIKWGSVSLGPAQTITVSGEAKTQLKNQVAVFSAGVSAVSDNKETAVSEVNQKVANIIESVKNFGIPESDVKTQNLSVYQGEESYYEEGRQKTRLGQWRVNNTVEITLRDVDKSSDLADLITQSGANNVYGPNFTLTDTTNEENSLLSEAIKDATQKAEIIAKSANRRLGRILTVNEGGSSQPVYYNERSGLGGAAAPIEPGSQTIGKTVTVTFEFR